MFCHVLPMVKGFQSALVMGAFSKMVVKPSENWTYRVLWIFLMVLLSEVGDARSVGRKIIQLTCQLTHASLCPGPLKYLPSMPSEMDLDGNFGFHEDFFGIKINSWTSTAMVREVFDCFRPPTISVASPAAFSDVLCDWSHGP